MNLRKMFGLSAGPKKRRSKNKKEAELHFATLEPKQLLASITLQDGVLVIDGSNSNDVARVRMVGNSTVRASLTGVGNQDFAASSVNEIRFLGRNGNDRFTNSTDMTSRAYGHAGNDHFTGGNGQDFFQGGAGDDTLRGRNGNDGLRGNGGNDRIEGGSGNDGLYGGSGNDNIGGDDGNDRIAGNSGNDSLSGDNGHDYVHGGSGNDFVNGGRGYDRINGGEGTDMSAYGSRYANYTITANRLTVVFSDAGGTETNDSIENFRFSDGDRVNNNPNAGGGNNGGSGNGGGGGSNGGDAMFSDAEVRSLSLLNSFRGSNGRAAVSTATDLSQFAENWAAEMSRTGFRHSSQASRNALAADRGSSTIGENIAFVTNRGQSLEDVAQTFHDLWVNSATHRANMLNRSYQEVGIGIVLGSDNRWYGVHVFTDQGA